MAPVSSAAALCPPRGRWPFDPATVAQPASRRHATVGRNVSVATADIYDPPTLRRHIAGADAVINLVGILNETRRDSFERVHVTLTRLVVDALP